MRSMHKINPVVRATGIIGVVAGLATAVTFAALQSQATLTDNTISSATASLKVSSDPGCATDTGHTTFSQTKPGFDFAGIIPGVSPSDDHVFCLWNDNSSETAADLALNVSTPSAVTWTPAASVNNSLTNLNITCDGGRSVTDTVHNVWFFTSNFSGPALAAGGTTVCTANVSMATNAFTGEGVVSDQFNLVFTGTGVAPTQ